MVGAEEVHASEYRDPSYKRFTYPCPYPFSESYYIEETDNSPSNNLDLSSIGDILRYTCKDGFVDDGRLFPGYTLFMMNRAYMKQNIK